MNILVCVKQVPGSSNVKVDEKTGLLIRSAKGNKLNPYDLFALETALTLREAAGGTVMAVSMGPPQAREALEECVHMGCDGGVLLSDRAFGGADVLATSYTISQGIRRIGPFDLILCGKQTTDGDTAQVGAELAEHLHIPHLSNAGEHDRHRTAGAPLPPLHGRGYQHAAPALLQAPQGHVPRQHPRAHLCRF